MDTAPSPPPPPPKSRGNQPRSSPPPRPGFAAIPFCSDSPPVQETSPSPEAVYHAEDGPLLPVQNDPQSPPSEGQEDVVSDGKGNNPPVQETDPAPQITEQQVEEANQTDQADEDQ